MLVRNIKLGTATSKPHHQQNQKKQDRREETSYDSPDEISTDQDSRNSNKGNITEKRSVKEKKGTLSYEALKLMS